MRSRSPSLTSSSSDSSSDDEAPRQTRFPYVPPPQFGDKVAKIVTDAKRKHRTDIKPHAWDREGFAGSDVCELPLDETNAIKREHARDLTVARFIQEYEKPFVPLIIEGIPETEGWGAVENWTLKKLRKNCKRAMLKCGEDDDGKSIRMKFKYFYKYLKLQTDDSPLYIFDSSFDDREDTKPLLADYAVPRYFPEDLFSLVGEDRRPPYRWFLVGPKRSGTCVHLDPLGTSAWNTLLVGRKRWVLFPPHVSKEIVKGKSHIKKGEDDEAVNYFMDILPRIKKAHSPEELQCIELMQYPGDTIFVPGGWWHAVFNVEDTVAVTQNYCSSQNFERVWRKTRTGRKRMAVKWFQKLQKHHPQLATLAVKLNREDGFVMRHKDGSAFEPEVLDEAEDQDHHTASDRESTTSSAESSMKKKKKKKKEEDENAKKRKRARME
ncbi:hypothetical protein Poli38472_001759 [Pythium oligandrum]|uniref:JmjC domain-containing protein n=1 Tax=Pythium oligandrum TaxID=41045 RepID=A0A8K1CVA6_PYTOL|nr:hypothetical protein Poli38472_001759 [Pythium oligandrum]|eukprot:TMW69603.1 hypothetical protein Poli38472_001759 [Pythium oligandrum]